MDDLTLYTKTHVHSDDMHVLGKLDDIIISGSKDCTVKSWNYENYDSVEGLELLNYYNPEKNHGYSHWITALEVFDDYCIFGTRSGQLVKWDPFTGEILKTQNFSSAEKKNCKSRNRLRVCGMGTVQGQLYVGVPGKILQVCKESLSLETSYPIHQNDWVYCIKEVGERIAIVVNDKLRMYRSLSSNYTKINNPREKNGSHPKISSLELLPSQNELLSSCFDGTVRIFNCDTHSLSRVFRGHSGRVWNSIPLSDDIFASGADDKTIKLWDSRLEKPCIWTSSKHNGRVSCLMESKNTLLCATCHETPQESEDKCCFVWRDFRKLI